MQRYRERMQVPADLRGPAQEFERVFELEGGEPVPEGAEPVPADTELFDWRLASDVWRLEG